MADDPYFIGLISGTSADGIDVACVRFEPFELAAFRTMPLAEDLRQQLLMLGQSQCEVSLGELAQLDVRVGQAFAEASLMLLRETGIGCDQIAAIGSHGQTLRHKPSGAYPYTLQVGDPNVIAERTGICTVADFRRRDVAAGGQGAPLVPAFHAAMWRDPGQARAVLNLGGIANISLLPSDGPIIGFDTGPANALMDAWVQLHRNEPFDAKGRFAAQGQVNPELLRRLLSDPWFAQKPPKSSGRDQFNLAWLTRQLDGLQLSAEDVQATLCQLSAQTVAMAVKQHMPQLRQLLVCGGGVHNETLLAAISELLAGSAVSSTAAFGLDPDAVEAVTFAWLARQTLKGLPGNVAEVTGAKGPRILGAIYPA